MRPPDSVPRWEKGLRRSAVGVLTAGPAALAIALMADLLWRTGLDAWKLALLAGFAVLITLVDRPNGEAFATECEACRSEVLRGDDDSHGILTRPVPWTDR